MRIELAELLLRLTNAHQLTLSGMVKSELEVAIDTVRQMIGSLRAVDTGWTAVTDALPQQSGWYWVWIPSTGASKEWYRAAERTFADTRATHWMMIRNPEGPEGWT